MTTLFIFRAIFRNLKAGVYGLRRRPRRHRRRFRRRRRRRRRFHVFKITCSMNGETQECYTTGKEGGLLSHLPHQKYAINIACTCIALVK